MRLESEELGEGGENSALMDTTMSSMHAKWGAYYLIVLDACRMASVVPHLPMLMSIPITVPT